MGAMIHAIESLHKDTSLITERLWADYSAKDESRQTACAILFPKIERREVPFILCSETKRHRLYKEILDDGSSASD